MKHAMAILPIFLCAVPAIADDNNVTNSNNVNNATTYQTNTNSNAYDNSGQSFSTVDNSADQSAVTNTDNSVGDFRNNTNHVNSDNQINASYTEQNINNSSTKTVNGNLVDGSYNNSNNTSGTNANGVIRVDPTIGQGQGQGQGQKQSQDQGQTQGQGQKLASNVNVSPSYVSNQVRQTPMAWSPNMAMSMSQENCNNSASLGASTGLIGVSGGVPINDDDCTRRRDAILWANLGQMRIACERMVQDSSNADAVHAAGLDCARLTSVETASSIPVLVPSDLARDTEDRLGSLPRNDDVLNATFAKYMRGK